MIECTSCGHTNTEFVESIQKYMCWECGHQFTIVKTCNYCYWNNHIFMTSDFINGLAVCTWCRGGRGHRAWKKNE